LENLRKQHAASREIATELFAEAFRHSQEIDALQQRIYELAEENARLRKLVEDPVVLAPRAVLHFAADTTMTLPQIKEAIADWAKNWRVNPEGRSLASRIENRINGLRREHVEAWTKTTRDEAKEVLAWAGLNEEGDPL